MAAKAKSEIITWKSPGAVSSPFVRIFMQITCDPIRSVKLLFDLKDCIKRFFFGIHVSVIACKKEHFSLVLVSDVHAGLKDIWVTGNIVWNFWPLNSTLIKISKRLVNFIS